MRFSLCVVRLLSVVFGVFCFLILCPDVGSHRFSEVPKCMVLPILDCSNGSAGWYGLRLCCRHLRFCGRVVSSCPVASCSGLGFGESFFLFFRISQACMFRVAMGGLQGPISSGSSDPVALRRRALMTVPASPTTSTEALTTFVTVNVFMVAGRWHLRAKKKKQHFPRCCEAQRAAVLRSPRCVASCAAGSAFRGLVFHLPLSVS